MKRLSGTMRCFSTSSSYSMTAVATELTRPFFCCKRKGLPLVVLRAPVIGYEQSRYMTRLLQMAVDQFGADWVAPLDADEFIEVEDGTTLAEALSGQENRLLSMAWNNFEWRPEYENDPERNPVIRQRLRRPARPDQNKLLVPAGLVDETTQLLQGNHFLIRDGRQLTPRPIQSISLGHFPIRSVDQYACKIAIGYLQYVAMPNWNRNIGFHYIEPFQALLKGGLEALKKRMVMDSRRLLERRTMIGPEMIAAVAHDEPLRYRGGLLKLAIVEADAFAKPSAFCGGHRSRPCRHVAAGPAPM